ncbi:class I SAM-dependent methyltransferase [Parapedobacter lycopersici]|uniref:class I SAM-dependent methyltransferase n=1 Tax=Parapedobacter lycopersici TaxID=1864939 RepID=UPI0033409DFE
MVTAILRPKVQQYLQTQETADAAQVALRKSPFTDIPPAALAQQVEGRQRCRKKLPLWHDTPGIYYPMRISIEQASSALTAQYKSRQLPTGGRVIDVTGGFGVDAFYFAQRVDLLTYCERHEVLAHIAQHNFNMLGATNVDAHALDGIAYLDTQPADVFDCIYIDPSRRKNRQRVFLLEDCEPDVVVMQARLLEKARYLYIKAAPLLDISAALQSLHHVRDVHIVSVDNECKELLFMVDRAYNGVPRLTAAALTPDSERTFVFTAADEEAAVSVFSGPLDYLYEPDAALLKAGAFKSIGQRFGLNKLHPHTHLYTSGERNPDFIGRTFRIDRVETYSTFKKEKHPAQANVSTRNFPLDAATLRKKHRIPDGGNLFLFFCTGPQDQLLVIFASKS